MIKYNLKDINDWNFDGSNVAKVYRNGAVVYYKVSGESPTPEYQVCFAVVDDITQYSEREFEDVYDKATEKWYKLNNLGEYEKYGVYASGRTPCEGSRLPQGYTEVEYVQNTASGANTSSTSRLAVAFEDSITNSESAYTYEVVGELTGIDNINAYFDFWGNGYVRLHRLDRGYRYVFEPSAFGKYKNGASTPTSGVKYRMKIYQGVSDTYPQFEITDITAGTTSTYSLTSNGSSNNDSTKLGLFHYYNVSDDGAKMTPAKIYEVIITDREGNELCHSVPCTRDSDGKIGFYNLVRDEFDYDASGELSLTVGDPISPTDCVTTYKGKLTIDEDYEYEWNGSSWANLGEVSGDSRLPSGYTEVEYVENTSTAYINTEVLLYDSTTNSYEIETKMSSTWGGGEFEYLLATEGTSDPYTGIELRWNTHYQSGKELQCESVPKNIIYSNIDNGDGTSAITISCSSTNATNNVPLSLFCGIWSSGPWRNGKGKIYDLKITKNSTLVRDLVPCKRDSDEMVGMYDIVSDVFYYPPNYQSYQLIAGPNSGSEEYPKYYEEKDEPLNNLTFNTMAEAEAYAKNNCVYDGLKATINGDRYKFVSDEGWVENGGGLPDVSFVLNYNAKQYNSSTKTLLKTEGQLANVDAVITTGTPTLHDEYLTITSSTRATISGYQNYFNRDNNNPNLTIISKQRTDGNNCHMFANRDSNYNWMYRCYSNKLTLHGSSEQVSLTVTTQPVIESVRVNSNRLLTYNNYTDNTSSTQSNFNYGGTNSGNFALFAGYATSTGEWFVGDFYWIYMCQGTLTDDQVQQVIDYNENL